MAKIEIYSSRFCGFCRAARQLLNRKSVEFIEYWVDLRPAIRREMTSRANGRTSVPQIFIDDHHVGGFDDVMGLEMDDELDAMLGLAERATGE